jgi:hypothetical protein
MDVKIGDIVEYRPYYNSNKTEIGKVVRIEEVKDCELSEEIGNFNYTIRPNDDYKLQLDRTSRKDITKVYREISGSDKYV